MPLSNETIEQLTWIRENMKTSGKASHRTNDLAFLVRVVIERHRAGESLNPAEVQE
jgi:hypothetical protein